MSDAKELSIKAKVIVLLRQYLRTPDPSLEQKENLLAKIQSLKESLQQELATENSEAVIKDTMQNILSWAGKDSKLDTIQNNFSQEKKDSICRSHCGRLFNLLTTPLKITVECKHPEIKLEHNYTFEEILKILQQYQEILQGYQKIRVTSVDRAFLKKDELHQNLRCLGALVKAQPKKFNLDELFSAIDQTITAIEQHPKQAATVQSIIDHMQRIIGRDDLQEVSQSRRTTEGSNSDSESDSEQKKISHSR